MRAEITLLVVLFSMHGAQTQSTQTEVQTEGQTTVAAEVSTQMDVSAELKELRDIMVEQGVLLRYTQGDVKVLEAENVAVNQRLADSENRVEALEKALQDTEAEMKTEVDNLKKENAAQETELAVLKTRLAATEAEVEDLKMMDSAALQELAALKTRLAATESAIQDINTTNEVTVTEVEDLKMDSAAHEQELAALKTRLAGSETAIDDLKKENAAQETELTAVKTKLAATETEVEDLKTRLAATETEVENLEKEIKAAPKVAFSAGLGSGYTQAGSNALNLVFSGVITNVGEAYSSSTGFFTAPVRGVYYFRFTVRDDLSSRWVQIFMHKNGQVLMYLGEYDTDGQPAYLSSGLTLQLEKGDTVNMVLPAGKRLYDHSDYNLSTFSGFLLFPL